MPLVCDATALVALGEIESIDLLKQFDPDVVISPWVGERELRRFTAQVRHGVEEGWLRVQEPSATEVRNLLRATASFELDQGEAETLVVARHQEGSPTTVLIDEGAAFVCVERVLMGRGSVRNWRLVCLAQVLHDLEAKGTIDSATETMQRLLDSNAYHWAPAVRMHYERWCAQHGIQPVAATKSSVG